LGVLIWLAFIDELAALVVWLTPEAVGLAGLDKLAAETPRQIANAHTIFNVANTLIFVGFAGVFARAVTFLVPDLPENGDTFRVKYLDQELLNTPSLALDRARLEILNMGDQARSMMVAVLPAVLTGTRESLSEVSAMDNAVDMLHGHIVTYLGRVSQEGLTEEQSEEFIKLMAAANDLESIGDVIETNLVSLGLQRIDSGVLVSPETTEVIQEFHAATLRALDLALQAVTQKNPTAAAHVIRMKEEITRLADSAAIHEARRLVAEEPNRLHTYTLEVDVLENLKRIYYFCKRMARSVS
jgi:phosphate:Na+ symporter